jgi:hypothetical protein
MICKVRPAVALSTAQRKIQFELLPGSVVKIDIQAQATLTRPPLQTALIQLQRPANERQWLMHPINELLCIARHFFYESLTLAGAGSCFILGGFL